MLPGVLLNCILVFARGCGGGLYTRFRDRSEGRDGAEEAGVGGRGRGLRSGDPAGARAPRGHPCRLLDAPAPSPSHRLSGPWEYGSSSHNSSLLEEVCLFPLAEEFVSHPFPGPTV